MICYNASNKLRDLWEKFKDGRNVALETLYDDDGDIMDYSEVDLAWRFWVALAAWSRKTFGSDKSRGPLGPIKHLKKEIEEEILPLLEDRDYQYKTAYMLEEFIDCFFLIIDAAKRAGFTYPQFMKEAFRKLEVNKNRKWNKPTSDEPVEHVRE